MRTVTAMWAAVALLGLSAPAVLAQTDTVRGSRWQTQDTRPPESNPSNSRWQTDENVRRRNQGEADALAREADARAQEADAQAREADAQAREVDRQAGMAVPPSPEAPMPPDAPKVHHGSRWSNIGRSSSYTYTYEDHNSRRRRRNGTRYLFEDSNVGAFGGPIFEIGQVVGGEIGTFTGGGGALVFNSRFFIGGYGMNFIGGLAEVPQAARDIHGQNTTFEMRHGGFWLGGNIAPDAVIHPSYGLRLGWGRAKWNNGRGGLSAEDRFFLVQPSVGIQANLLSWMRINLEGGYRYVTGVALPGTGERDLNGLSGLLSVTLGGWD